MPLSSTQTVSNPRWAKTRCSECGTSEITFLPNRCDTLAANAAWLFTELKTEAVELVCLPKLFLSAGSVHGMRQSSERFVKLPLTRWQRLMEPEHLIAAVILAVVFALLFKWL